MKKLLLLAVGLILTAAVLAGCGNKAAVENTNANTTQAPKTALKVALDASYRPMEWMENTQIIGFDADLMNALGKEMGRNIELQNVAWDNIFDGLYAGNYDLIISSVSINAQRKQTMLFSDPYFDSTSLILTKKSEKINSAKDLSSKKVALQSGTQVQDQISQNIPGVSLLKFGTGDEAFKSFANGQADAVVSDSPVVLDYVKQNPNPDYVTVKDEAFFGADHFGIVANKGKDSLISEVNAALAKLKANGEYQQIYDKYFK